MSAVNSTSPSPQKLHIKNQSWSKIYTNTLGQIDTFNYTVICSLWCRKRSEHKSYHPLKTVDITHNCKFSNWEM